MRLTPPVSYDGENHACMQDIKSKAGPSLFTRLRESSRGATREPLLSVARPSTSMVHWQSGGEKWAECGGVSDWLVDDARKKKRTDPGAGQSGPSTSSSCLGCMADDLREGGREEMRRARKTDERRKDIRHLSAAKPCGLWMVLKPLPVRQTRGNCVPIKRFRAATAVHVELSENPALLALRARRNAFNFRSHTFVARVFVQRGAIFLYRARITQCRLCCAAWSIWQIRKLLTKGGGSYIGQVAERYGNFFALIIWELTSFTIKVYRARIFRRFFKNSSRAICHFS